MYKILNTLLVSIVGGLIVLEISNNFESVNIWPTILTVILIFIILNMVVYLRNRVKIKIIKQTFIDPPITLNFTAMNMGNYRNSLDKRIILKWLEIPFAPTFPYGKKYKHVLSLNDFDNSLNSHETKEFKATIKGNMPHFFSNFRHYRFTPNKGMHTHLYFIGPTKRDKTWENVSFVKFYFKYFLYRFFKVGLVYNPDKTT